MNSNWRPDDSFIDSEGGELKGVKRAREAQAKHNVEQGGVILSSDPGVREATDELIRTHLPAGFKQRQLPIALGPNKDAVAFVTDAEPGAIIPKHAHRCDLFRVVISGSITTGGSELGPGDWMYVRAGAEYDLVAGPRGASVYHIYW